MSHLDTTCEFVKLCRLLNGFVSQTASKLRLVSDPKRRDFAEYEPRHRMRLDHCGNDGDGWDDDLFFESYEKPLINEIAEHLFHHGFEQGVHYSLEIDDKGFVTVFPG